MLGALAENAHQLDVIEFGWATIELMDDADADTEAIYRPFLSTLTKCRRRESVSFGVW